MSNISKVRREPVFVDLDKARRLKYTLNSFAMLEEKYGSVDAALKKMEGGSILVIRFILWAGLVHEDKSLTEEQVGDMIDIQDMDVIAEKMGECMKVDLPDKPEADKAKVTQLNNTAPNLASPTV